jgi:S-DNA-T family DNA segregation ATPase FtsK/SpoIIIE
MAQNTYKSNTFKKPEKEKKSRGSKTKFSFAFLKDPRFKLAVGFFLLIVSAFLFLSMFSYLFTGQADQSVVGELGASTLESGRETRNWLGFYGAVTSHYFIYRWFGISAFFIPPLLFIVGFKIVFNRELLRIFSFSILSIFSGVWLSLLLGYMTMINDGVSEWSFLGGGLGYNLAIISDGLFGWGTFLILILSLFIL